MPGIGVDARDLIKKLKKAQQDLNRRIDQAVGLVARDTRERIARDYWRNRTGRTRAATKVEKLGRAHYRVAVRVPWAAALDTGSEAHVIRPRNKKALGPVKFGGGRKKHFFKSANHPGFRGYFFSKREARRLRVTLPLAAAEAVRAAFKLDSV